MPTSPSTSAPPERVDLADVRARAFDLRWLTPEDRTRISRGPLDREVLVAVAELIGTDVPALADEVEQLRSELDAARDAVRQRAPQAGAL